MTDNQKSLVLGINLLNKLIDMAEKGHIDLVRLQLIVAKVLEQIKGIQQADVIKQKMNYILQEEQINIKVDYQLN